VQRIIPAGRQVSTLVVEPTFRVEVNVVEEKEKLVMVEKMVDVT